MASDSKVGALLAAAAAAALVGGCAHREDGGTSASRLRALAALARDWSIAGQARIEASMDPAALALARRLDGGRRPDAWGRTEGWAALDVQTPPWLGFGQLSPGEAQRINAYLPGATGLQAAAAPFVLRTDGPERDRALLCLTQAIYYEGALEPEGGQEAIAQTVINRLRHPAFPKSICGVVYQGSEQVTGCQFSFTCDGSRDRPPERGYWDRARAVAARALSGFVQRAVGTATYYHADYVFPRWGPTLVKIAQVGAHIFYRFPGPAGAADSLVGRYGGGELRVSMAGPPREAVLAAKAAAEAGLAPVNSFSVIDPTAPNGLRTRVAGEVVFGRRIPTKDEIAQINRSLAALEAAAKPPTAASPAAPVVSVPPAAAPAQAGPAFADKLPMGTP